MTQAATRPRRPSLRVLILSLLLAFGALLGLPIRAAADGPTTFDNTSQIIIPGVQTPLPAPAGPAAPYPSNINVSGMTGTVTKVTVTFHNLSHGIANDIDAMVVAPDGRNLIVMSDASDANTFTFASNATITFDDTAPSALPGAGAIASGPYKPTNRAVGGADSFPSPAPTPSNQTTLAGAFTGLVSANGTWSLYAVDDTNGDVGTMAGGWSLTITTEVAAVSTTTTVTSSDAESATGQAVTFTATVRTATDAPVTAGTVQFSSDGVDLGAPVQLTNTGTASRSTATLTEGTHEIRAIYSGVTGFLTSNGTTSQRVDNATVVTGNTFCNTGVITGPGFSAGTATPYPSKIFATGLTGQVTKVTANLKGVTHAESQDLDILLSGPTPATNVVLLSDVGGNGGTVSNANLVFDDTAASTVPSPIETGTFRPTDIDAAGSPADSFPATAPTLSNATTLSTFNGASGNGTWSLWVVDDASADSGSIDGGWCLTITSQSPTTTALTAAPNPSTYGQEVTLSATVTSGGDPVTGGSVQFRDGATDLGAAVPVSAAGVATLTTSALTVGTHTITATYGGTETLATSNSQVDQVVSRIVTETALTSLPNPSNVGETVTFIAAVTADGEPVTAGSVQFAVDGTNTGGAVDVGPDGAATFTTGALSADTHEITATYSGTGTLGGSEDDLSQVVERIATSTALTSSLNPSDFNQTVTFTATVTAGGTPVTGTVQFADDGSPLGAPVPVAADGTASYTTSVLAVGSHPITATFVQTASLGSSHGDLDQVVGQAASTVTVLGTPNPSTYGQSVTFTAAVTSAVDVAGQGNVQFRVDGALLGGAVDLGADGTARSDAITTLSVGTHTITATYSGTSQVAGNGGSVNQVVGPAASQTTLTTAPDPSTYGQNLVMTATVTGGGSPVTEGTVAFSEGGTIFCEEAELAVDGSATCEVDDLAVGTHTLAATYSGATDYAASGANDDHVVNPAATTTVVTSSANPSQANDMVTWTATVTSENGGPVTTGPVTFYVNGIARQLDDVDADGHATYTTNTLSPGVHTIRAEYGQTESYAASSSTDLSQTVELHALAGGPYTVAEGAALTLDGSASTRVGTYEWDVNGDGVYGDATGVDPTLTWADLESLGIDDGPATFQVRLRIELGSVPFLSDPVDLTVTNTAPASVLTGGLAATVGVPFTIKVGAEDPSSADMAALFTYTVDWGDGSPVLTVDGPADPPVTHVYATEGDFDAVFTATDKDGGTGPGTQVVVAANPAQVVTPSPTPTTASPSDDDDDNNTDDNNTDDSDGDDTSSSNLASTGSPVGLGAFLLSAALLASGGGLLLEARRRRRTGNPRHR